MYAQAFPKDKIVIKLLVSLVYVVQLAQVVLYTDVGFKTFTEVNNIVIPDTLYSRWFSVWIITGLGESYETAVVVINLKQIVGSVVQLFYAWRIFIISRKRLPPVLIALVCNKRLLQYDPYY